MNNCDNWYEMTEQALSTINKLMPAEASDPSIEIFPAIQQSTVAAASSKPTVCSNISMSPIASSHVSLATLQDNKNPLLESRRPYNDDCDNETQTNDDIQSNGAPCADSIGQKLKTTSPPDQFPVEKDAVERQVSVGRGVTLVMLLADSLIKAGTDVLSFEHSGETFLADLQANGKIRWSKEDRIFQCTSSWIVHCKKTAFPQEKLTCSITEQVKYKGKSLDHYKLAWLKKHKPFVNTINSRAGGDLEMECRQQDITRMNTQMEDDEPELNWILGCSSSMINYQESIPHVKLGRRSFQGIPNLFVECSSFTKMNRVQPFKLNITKNCLLLLHFHCHLLGSEVIGYLAGKWDSTAQQLIVSQAYPCKCSLNAPKDETDRVEYDIMTNMDKSNLILVGWYHSHVGCPADPSLRDVETQMEYQFQLKGYESATFQPCVGLVISPFHMKSPAQLTSDMKIFYVYPPSEQRPLDYGMPLEVEHTISKDDYVTDRIISEMEKLIKFYSSDSDYLPKKFKKSNLPVYLNRLKNCLSPFCPSGYLSESIVKVFENF